MVGGQLLYQLTELLKQQIATLQIGNDRHCKIIIIEEYYFCNISKISDFSGTVLRNVCPVVWEKKGRQTDWPS
jgi:hypothetical protein